jgi:hypothetical protein
MAAIYAHPLLSALNVQKDLKLQYSLQILLFALFKVVHKVIIGDTLHRNVPIVVTESKNVLILFKMYPKSKLVKMVIVLLIVHALNAQLVAVHV